MKMARVLSWYVFAVSLLCLHPAVIAGPVYRFSSLIYGDTASPVDINDLGHIVYSGFGDSTPGGASVGPSGLVLGYGYAGSPVAGVQVTDLNNAGDMFGTAIRVDGVSVPTIWIGGSPFDLTDPVNSGLSFAFDPGPKWQLGVDVASLTVFDLPGTFDPGGLGGGAVLTNARGDFVFAYDHVSSTRIVQTSSGPFYGILTRVLPLPGTLALATLGVAALLIPGSGLKRRTVVATRVRRSNLSQDQVA